MTRPTLHDVAAAAGVSLASASRVLSGGGASAAMVRRVRAAAAELHYLTHGTARALRAGAVRRVAFGVDDIGNPNYVAMLRSIEGKFGGDGPHVSVSSTNRPDQTLSWIQGLSRGGADGLIISSIRSDDLLRQAIVDVGIPTVVIGSLGTGLPVDCVRVDSAAAVGLAVRHVHALGCRNIAFVNGPPDTLPGAARERGFDSALRGLGYPLNPAHRITAKDFTMEAGRAGSGEILDRRSKMRTGDRLDAVVASNDLLALGVIVAAVSAGLRVPRDLAVVGVDDTELAAMYNPSLTSVSLFAGRRGAIAADLLMRRFEDPGRPAESVSVRPKLIVRDSTIGHLSERRRSG